MTREKTVKGIVSDSTLHIVPTKITLRVTKDGFGKSISLESDDLELMFEIPIEKVLEELRWVIEE